MKSQVSIAPSAAAVLFIDLQEEHRRDPRYLVQGYDTVLANARSLQNAARTAGVAVLHAAYIVDPIGGKRRRFHPVMADGSSAFSNKGSPLSALCPEVAPVSGEEVFFKDDASAFSNDRLGERLASDAVEWLFIAGVWTEACVDATVKAAVSIGLRVFLVKDACGSGSAAMHQTGILNLANRLYGGAVVNTQSASRLMAGETVEAWTTESPVPLRYCELNITELYDAL